MNTTPPPASNSRFHDKCLSIGFCLALVLAFLVIKNVEIGKLPDELGKYLGGAVACFAVYEHFQKNLNGKPFFLKLIDIVMISILLLGIYNNRSPIINLLSGKNEMELTNEFVRQTRDSTEKFKTTLNMADIYKDCEGIGSKIKRYRNQVLSDLFKKEHIPEKDTLQYKASVDSALGDPITDACNRAGRFGQMQIQLAILIRAKNVNGIDDFFREWNISPSASAVVLGHGSAKMRYPSLKDYIVNIIQGIVPDLKEIQPPIYSEPERLIEELIFTTQPQKYTE